SPSKSAVLSYSLLAIIPNPSIIVLCFKFLLYFLEIPLLGFCFSHCPVHRFVPVCDLGGKIIKLAQVNLFIGVVGVDKVVDLVSLAVQPVHCLCCLRLG